MKHTPGPWQADIRNGSITVYEASKDFNCLDIPRENFVAYWHRHHDYAGNWYVREEDKANARLIAAAPELLEALQMQLDACNLEGCQVCEKGLQAIAKVEEKE